MSSVTQHLMGKLFSKRKKTSASAGTRPSTAPAGSTHSYGDHMFQSKSSSQLIHSDAVVSLSAVRPGACLSGSKDQTVVLFNYDKGSVIDKWEGHDAAVTKVVHGADKNIALSASRDQTIKLWQPGQKSACQEFIGHSLVVSAIDINSDNTQVCSGSRDNCVKLWDVHTGTCVKTNNIAQNLVTDVKFVPDSTLLVQTGEDKEIRVFDCRSLQPVFSFPKKQYIQMSCHVNRTGNYILSCSNGFSGSGCEATLWDLRERRLVLEYRGHHEAVEACHFLPGSKTLVATASRDCSVRIWDMLSGLCEVTCDLSGAGPLTSLAAYDDGSLLVSSFNTGVHLLQLTANSLTQVNNY